MIEPSARDRRLPGSPAAPAVSVVIPTYNRLPLLERLIERLLDPAPDTPPFELIVVDDGSTDGTDAYLRSLEGRVRVHQAAHGGPARARNLGWRAARAEIVAFVDDDCLPPRDWVAKLLDGFRQHPEAAAVGGYQEPPNTVTARSALARYDVYRNRSYGIGDQPVLAGFECPAGGSNNIAYRKAVLEAVGGFDESYTGAAGEDADLKWRVCELGYRLLFVPLKVEHYQPYTWRGFVRQQLARGRGAQHYLMKHRPEHPLVHWLRLGAQIVLWPARAAGDLARIRPLDVALLRAVVRVLHAAGGVSYLAGGSRRRERG